MQMRKRLPLALVTHERSVPVFVERRKTDRRASSGDAKKLKLVFDAVSDALITLDSEGKIDWVNPAAEEISGYLASDLHGKSVEILGGPQSHSRAGRDRGLSIEITKSPGTYEDISIVTRDGERRWVELSVRTLDALSVLVLRDVTEKKKMERELLTKHAELRNAFLDLERVNAELRATQESLVQAGKMAALGELAAGIAHELNQPLMAIRGYAQELQFSVSEATRNSPLSGEVSIGFSEIISAADKMSKIISHLRTFTRKSTEDFEWTSVESPIEEAFKMVSRQFESRGIEIRKNYEPNLTVFLNPLSLEQVFINLATNARDAIEATGRGRGKIEVTTRSQGPFVEIRFRDDGVGMDRSTQSKAFNPFFTTKEVGKGMGLGLSLAYGILSKVHGSIRIESEEGKGTEFIIRIPKDYREHG